MLAMNLIFVYSCLCALCVCCCVCFSIPLLFFVRVFAQILAVPLFTVQNFSKSIFLAPNIAVFCSVSISTVFFLPFNLKHFILFAFAEMGHYIYIFFFFLLHFVAMFLSVSPSVRTVLCSSSQVV